MKKYIYIISCYFIILLILGTSPCFCKENLSIDQKLAKIQEMYKDYRKDFPDIKEISPLEAMKMNENGQAVFVDTRHWYETRISMLPGAIKKKKFIKDISRYKDKKIIAYCTVGYRSGEFAEEMDKKGISIYNLEGGIVAWVLEGGKIYDEKGETRRVHVYEKDWNYIPEGYKAKMKPEAKWYRIGKFMVYRPHNK